MALSKYENSLMSPSPEVLAVLRQALELPAEFFSKEVSLHNYTALFNFGPAFLHRDGSEQRYAAEEYFARHAELDDLLGAPEAKPLWNVWLYEGPDTFEGAAGTCGPRLVVVLNKSLSRGIVRLRAVKELAYMVWEDGLREFPIKEWPDLCEKLARSLLMPGEDFREMLGARRRHVAMQEIRALAGYYGVTGEAVIARAVDLECIAESTAMRMRLAWIKSVKESDEVESLYAEEPRRFQLLLRRAMAEKLIPEEKILELAEGLVPKLNEQEILK